MRPSFIVIGAARSGSTSLYQYLNAHPEVFLPAVKELNFFSNEKYWSKGFKWYESNFATKDKAILLTGEVSPSYTRLPFTENVPKRIFNYNPEMKLIYIVRNPIERLISHYLHRVQRGYETRNIESIISNLNKEAFASQGLYHYQLSQYLNYFNRSQLHIIDFQSLKTDTQKTLSKLYQFLQITPTVQIKNSGKVHNANKEIYLKSAFGLQIMSLYHNHLEQRNLPNPIRQAIMKLSNIGGKNLQKPSLTEEQFQRLTSFYLLDSEKLAEDYSIDINSWFIKS